jgi:phytoene synthase
VSHPLLEDRRTDLPVAAAYRFCAGVARRRARNFFYAFRPLRRSRREALYAVYSFARLADDLADEPEQPLKERMKRLDELEQRLDETLAGRPAGQLFIALSDAVGRFGVPGHALHELLAGMRQDQTVTRYATFTDLSEYCYLAAGTIGLACAAIFEARGGAQAADYAVAQGLGMQLINILRDVGEDAATGRIYLPVELLERYGVSEEEVRSGRTGTGWAPLMADLAARARTSLEDGARLLPLVARDARICPALLRDLYGGILDRIEAAGWDVFSRRIELGLPAKLGLLARAFLRYRFQ